MTCLLKTGSPLKAARKLAYLKFAYPDKEHSLQADGYILSTGELAEIAAFLDQYVLKS